MIRYKSLVDKALRSIQKLNRYRTLILTLSAIVVFVVSYLLILPAITLDEKEAERQGGIDVVTESSVTADQDTSQEDSEQPESTEKEKKTDEGQKTPTYKAGELSYDGKTFDIEAAYKKDAKIPEGTELKVEEIVKKDDQYQEYYDKALQAVQEDGQKNVASASVHLYDISLISNGEEIEPSDTVDVKITYEDGMPAQSAEQLRVIHFTEDKKDGEVKAEVLDSDATDFKVENDKLVEAAFKADSFSVYAIVDAPETAEVTDISSLPGGPYHITISRNGTNYAMNETVRNGQVYEIKGTTSSEDAGEWYFENAQEGNNQVYIYYLNGDEKMYINISSNWSISFTTTPQALSVEKTVNSEDTFYIYTVINNQKKALSVRGSRNFFFEARDNGVHSNEMVTVTRVVSSSDPYNLDGKTYGIAYHNDSTTSAALIAETKDTRHLVAQQMQMKPDVLDNDGVLLVSGDSDITEWTFHYQDGRYYLSTEADGSTKYLALSRQTLTLVDSQEQAAPFTVAPGSGANSGKYSFTVDGYSVALDSVSKGFWGSNASSIDTKWLNLVEKSTLDDDDFKLYTAKKVSVSDNDSVYNGQKVIVYTRIWNDTKKKYEFFAIDHDGSMIPCSGAGDEIRWIGSTVNTALWDFTEYTYSDGTPNYYYELQNDQYDDYIAPQLTGGQILSNNTIGINLNGRRYGENYTTIIAWDDYNYSYSGLKVENGHIVPCPVSEADDFYFAIIEETNPDDTISTVDTIDSEQYGITMKMVDFNNSIQNASGGSAPQGNGGRDSGQTAVLGYNTNAFGLVSTDLKENGYPDTNSSVTGKPTASLQTLFGSATPVNQLFLQSIYNESGYFEYDSTQNFAHLNEDGTFTVYDQLGSVSDYTGITAQHGQFFPYNSLRENQYCPQTNNTNVLAQELPDTDARKGEKLYDLGKQNELDYFFGMEMEASFTQTADGLDAWGHDIIFEFSGDDDFWLYVDGELILDVGGVHAASVGTINFKTGEVNVVIRNVNGSTAREIHSNLRDLFKENYLKRNPSATTDQINEYLSQYFEDGSNVFKDYSNHTMKMFYMERGAGASNLHMRFNLASVKPGTFILSKKLTGTDSTTNNLIEFPYQIWYTSKNDSEPHLLGEKEGDTDRVKYNGTNNNVTYRETYQAAGVDEPYDHVFLLKSGQSAEVDLPDDALSYWVVECGINPIVYDQVSVNGDVLTGTDQEVQAGTGDRKDYFTTIETLEDRQRVEYENHVDSDAVRTLSITKKLYDQLGNPTTYEEDDTPFNFRLYLGNENADSSSLPGAYLYPYLVKDKDGHYCRWDAPTQKFVTLEYTDYESLREYLDQATALEREAIVFSTSPNGSITRIPADHTVEVRDLLVGTQWKVEERDNEIPKGYTRRNEDGYVRTDGDDPVESSTPISGTMQVNEDPKIDVQNQRGWGLTVEKVWTDKDFMVSHDPIYFAVFLDYDRDGDLDLYPDTIHQLQTGETEIYYFFDDLFGPNADNPTPFSFGNYVIREVMISTPDDQVIINDKGVVTNPGEVTPIEPGETLTVGGVPVGGEHQELEYTVLYDVGEATGSMNNANIRTDTVTNSRPGIKIYKTKWDYETPLSDTVFTLKDSEGNDVAASQYTSNQTGLVTIAYLSPGIYYLEEIGVPSGYTGLDQKITITVSTDEQGVSSFVLDGTDDYYQFAPATTGETDDGTVEEMATLTVRNRTADFLAKKVDVSTREPLEGVHFALYREVVDTEGNKRPSNVPETGYEDIVTDANGILPDIDFDHLTMGLTYYLRETATVAEYQKFDKDLCFEVGANGKIKIITRDSTIGQPDWVIEEDEDGHVTYTLEIPNGLQGVELPYTGGSGTHLIYLFGALLILLSAAGLAAKKRREAL